MNAQVARQQANQRKAILELGALFAKSRPGELQARKANKILNRYCRGASQVQEEAILTAGEEVSELLRKVGVAA